ncbi:FAD NAD(P)-binding domain protein [Fusarium subglutinans]|uniref:FAD NAD(P)-binding domain protein n=1 Tax=Gibberella subglutinans TaxID=42677 RepID=A0A8H5LFM0_GIBSU|nr:FAD NAD(P)-binding domain protein [Fusarium subglutinans]KAF5590567.1 FAD NAD(P)-binding domain protein [Fusarium subglutinans]
MPSQNRTLKLNSKLSFGKIFEAGSFIVFYSSSYDPVPDTTASIDNTSVNITSADDEDLLHISFRRVENQIVFNSRLKDTQGNLVWGSEERVPLQGVFSKTDVTILVRLEDDVYQVYVDDSIIHSYKKRIRKDARGVSYRANTKSLFTDPIQVQLVTPDAVSDIKLKPATSYEAAYFTLKPEDIAAESEKDPFDYVIIGSGIGGGMLATDLLDKNKRMSSSFSSQSNNSVTRSSGTCDEAHPIAEDTKERTKRILVIERGNLLFPTHSLNMPRPTSRGTYGQMNDLFYNHFKSNWEMDDETRKIWKGGPVYCLGGRSTVWGLFCPSIQRNLRKAEEWMNISYPQTLPLHRALKDSLNLHDEESRLPTTQWEWGRVASEFRNPANFDFAEGAFSTVDRLLEAAMDNHNGQGKFKILINSLGSHLEPQPQPGKKQSATHVVVSAKDTFGSEFARNFGHLTDHYIFYVTMPFYYKDMKLRNTLGGVKLQTDIKFNYIDQSTALANISLDASSFLPRRNIPDSELPQFIIAYILPSQLSRDNEVDLDDEGRTRIKVGYADDGKLDKKKIVLKDFAVDVMNKIAVTLDIQFVQHKFDMDDYVILPKITKDNIQLGELGPGGVAHELGSIPMPNASKKGGILDENLKMQYGWDNVYVCDLSVFPYSPAANPTLSLAALSLRLSDHLVPPKDTDYQPIVVRNLCPSTVYVTMTLSHERSLSWDPSPGKDKRVKLESGQSMTWKREQKETIFIYSSETGKDFNVQIVEPGVTALITESP